MFSRISRYRKLPDVSSLDADGRVLSAKDVRLNPTVTGKFKHVVNAGDRLDQLSYKYYGQPLQWWNICDANPDFLSPLALLGQEPLVTTRFPVATPTSPPPWARVLRTLRAIVGVENVDISEEVELVPQEIKLVPPPPVGEKTTITTFAERYSRAVLVTYNRMKVEPSTLATAIEGAGFDKVFEYVDLDRIGQEIVIPPKPVG
jgi:hypothetical protein